MTGEIFFLKNHAENEAGRLVPDLLFLQVVCSLVSMYFDIHNLAYNKNKLYIKL